MLPYSYNEDRLILLPVDPNTLVAYWDFREETWRTLTEEGATHLHLTMHCEGSSRTFGTGLDTRSYYFRGIPSDRDYWLEIGYVAQDRLRPLMESPPVRTPADRPSEDRRVQFRRFQFLTPPEQPGSTLTGWREFYRKGRDRWGLYGEMADSLRLSRPLRTTPSPPVGGSTMGDGLEALFYYENGGRPQAGTSSSIPANEQRQEEETATTLTDTPFATGHSEEQR